MAPDFSHNRGQRTWGAEGAIAPPLYKMWASTPHFFILEVVSYHNKLILTYFYIDFINFILLLLESTKSSAKMGILWLFALIY